MTILVYQDYVSNNELLFRSLCQHSDQKSVAFCDADDLKNGCLTTETKLFVMPGGADLYYCEKLNGKAASFIRKWVEAGGTYLGICAGAYFACTDIEWAKGSDQEISGPRELAFFRGKAIGPVYSCIEQQDISKSWYAAPTITYKDGNIEETTSVFYEGGPVFIPDTSESSVTILATYDELDGPNNAIVECRVGKGTAVLCSPHLELSSAFLAKRLYRHNNPSYDWEAKIVQKMEKDDGKTRHLWNHILNRCLEKL